MTLSVSNFTFVLTKPKERKCVIVVSHTDRLLEQILKITPKGVDAVYKPYHVFVLFAELSVVEVGKGIDRLRNWALLHIHDLEPCHIVIYAYEVFEGKLRGMPHCF